MNIRRKSSLLCYGFALDGTGEKTHHCHDNNNKMTIKKVNSFIKHTLRQHPDEKIQGHTNTRKQSFFFIIIPKGYVLRV